MLIEEIVSAMAQPLPSSSAPKADYASEPRISRAATTAVLLLLLLLQPGTPDTARVSSDNEVERERGESETVTRAHNEFVSLSWNDRKIIAKIDEEGGKC